MQNVLKEISLDRHMPKYFQDIILQNQDFDEKNQFFEAIQYNMNKKVEEMLNFNRMLVAERNNQLQTPLHMAILHKNYKIIPILMKSGASIQT